MVEHHTGAELRDRASDRMRAAIALRLAHKSRHVEEFIAFKNFFLIPAGAVPSETQTDAIPPHLADLTIGSSVGKAVEAWRYHRGNHGGHGVAPIFPGEEVIPVAPLHPGHSFERKARKRQIADGHDARTFARPYEMPPPVAESVQLFDITELQTGLFLYPTAQT